MTQRSFLALLLVTVAAVGGAIFDTSGSSNAGIAPDRDKPVVPGLLDQANQLAEIVVDPGAGKMDIHRAGGRFIDASGYPVKTQAVRDLVTSLGRLTVEENKTADPKRYAELTLAPPGSARGAGTAVTLKTADGKVLADVVVGGRDYTVGAADGGQYIRLANNPRSYLARGKVTLPGTRVGWFDPALAATPEAEIASLTLMQPGKDAISLTRHDGKLAPVDLAEGRKPDDEKIKQLADLFTSLSFDDVRKADANPAGGAVLAIETTKGLKLTLDAFPQTDKAQAGWVTISAQATGKEAEAEAKSLSGRLTGFAFKLPPRDVTELAWSLDDIAPVAKPAASATAPKPDPTAPPAPEAKPDGAQ